MNKGNLTILPSGDCWSYNTLIKQTLPDGRTIGNVTKYSVTTSKHQNMVNASKATVTVDNVPQGATDLQPYVKK